VGFRAQEQAIRVIEPPFSLQIGAGENIMQGITRGGHGGFLRKGGTNAQKLRRPISAHIRTDTHGVHNAQHGAQRCSTTQNHRLLTSCFPDRFHAHSKHLGTGLRPILVNTLKSGGIKEIEFEVRKSPFVNSG